jgi:hypothetical protein
LAPSRGSRRDSGVPSFLPSGCANWTFYSERRIRNEPL